MSLEGRDEAFGVEWEVAAKPESVDPMLRRMLEHACEAQYRPSVALVQRLFELSGQAADAKSSTGLFASGSSVPSLAGPPVSASVRVAIGFDCEWDVKFVKGLQPPVSVIQLGTGREAVVVHLPMSAPLAPANGTEPGAASREPGSQTEHTAWEVPASVRDLLEDESVAKLGINCSGDALKLARDFGVRTRGLVDVAKLWAAHTGAMTATGLPASIGLKEVAKAALGLDIPKDDHLRIAPWSGAKALTAARMRYAALDAALPVRVLQRMQAELTPLLSGGDASTKFEMAAEQPSYGKQPSQGPGKSQPAESTLLPASAGPRRQAAAAAARTADVAEAICGQPARKSSQAAVTPAAAYSAVATNLLAAQILPVSQESQALNRAAEQLARLPWEARAHAMWMWKQVPAQRLASALAKSVEDVLGAVLRAIEHRDGLEPPAEIVVLSERDGGAKGQGAHVEPAGERTVDDRDAARVVSVSSGLPYRWAGLSVSPRDEAACLRRLRCLEAATGLANAKLNPTPTTGGAAPASADLSLRGFQSCIIQDCEPAGLDDLLLGIHGCLMDSLFVPPVIVAQGTGCNLAQKYIETYGARAMVLVAPSAPDLGPTLQRLAPASDGLSGAGFDEAVAAALRPGSAEDFARRWLLSASGAEVSDALAVATHVTRSGGINTRLLEELRGQPVELEPSPIPMMLVGSAGDALFPPDNDLRLLAEYHELEPEDVHIVGARGFGGQSGHVPGHALLVEEALDSEHSSVLSAITQFIVR